MNMTQKVDKAKMSTLPELDIARFFNKLCIINMLVRSSIKTLTI